MRFAYFLIAAMAGFLICDDVTASVSDLVEQSKTTISANQALHAIGYNRFLRSQPTNDDETDDKPTNDGETSKNVGSDTKKSKDVVDDSSSQKHEERGIIVDGIYQEKYQDWFDEGKTPVDVAADLGLDDFALFENPVKRRIYKGYERFYYNACDEPRNRRFCRENADEY